MHLALRLYYGGLKFRFQRISINNRLKLIPGSPEAYANTNTLSLSFFLFPYRTKIRTRKSQISNNPHAAKWSCVARDYASAYDNSFLKLTSAMKRVWEDVCRRNFAERKGCSSNSSNSHSRSRGPTRPNTHVAYFIRSLSCPPYTNSPTDYAWLVRASRIRDVS